MSERKAINKWYPPDFDPSKVKKVHKKKNGSAGWPTVRMMTPFSMQCVQCNEYISKSKKFNAKKETTAKDYLGIRIVRFHLRCPRCFNSLVFETDPKNADYECVSGCKRSYERSKAGSKKEESTEEMIARLEEEDRQEMEEKEREKRRKRGLGDRGTETGLEQLEKRLRQQQKEQERAEELEDLRERNWRLEKAGERMKRKREEEEDEDEREAREVFERRKRVVRGEKDKAVDGRKREEDVKETIETGEKDVKSNTHSQIQNPLGLNYTSSDDSD